MFGTIASTFLCFIKYVLLSNLSLRLVLKGLREKWEDNIEDKEGEIFFFFFPLTFGRLLKELLFLN